MDPGSRSGMTDTKKDNPIQGCHVRGAHGRGAHDKELTYKVLTDEGMVFFIFFVTTLLLIGVLMRFGFFLLGASM